MKNGRLWLDTDGRGIQAHGGSILQHNGIFYWYGENKDTDTHNRSVDFVGFSCYKSRDLLHWENCGLVLSAVNELGHDLHPDSVCERPSVLYNAETQKFVLWFHLDNRRYTRAEVGLAVSDTPTGPFTYMGSQRPGSHDSRDFAAFQDRDGRAYLFCSSDWNATMRVWELDKTYTKLTGSGKEILIDQAREAPALWHSGEKYLLFSSGCTGWSPNTMLYAESSAIFGSWRLIDDPCHGPGARQTFGAQSAAVFAANGQPYLLLDHWHPDDLRNSGYTILPVTFENGMPTVNWQGEWTGI